MRMPPPVRYWTAKNLAETSFVVIFDIQLPAPAEIPFDMYTFDHTLFLALNFDGGPVVDRIMTLCSTPAAWAWLYALMLWLVWRRGGWRALLLFVATAAVALGLADMVAGIFKHTGLLGGLWPSFPARLRPMHTPELEGLVHTVREGGLYGTVSAHAATMTALCVTSVPAVRRRWFSVLIVAATLVVCYSRIYLAYHFPADIVLGVATGLLSGAVARRAAAVACRRLCRGADRG